MAVKLSIVIPSHSQPELLERCVRSVLRHAPHGTEILVVDDGSRHGSVSAVARRIGVPCLRRRKAGGFCRAVNAGLGGTRGALVEVLNDDTEVSAGWAEAALEVFQDGAVGAVAPLVLVEAADADGGPRIDSAGDRYYLGGVAGKRGHGEPLTAHHLRSASVFGASASSAFYRRAALERIGGFPDSFGAYFEDVDVAFRLHRAGYQVRYEPGSRVWHRGSASYGRGARPLVEQQSRNEERVFWRNLPRRDLLRALPRHLAVLAAKAGRRCGEGTIIPFLCGRLRVVAELPDLLAYRRGLQAMLPASSAENWHVEWSWWGETNSTDCADRSDCAAGRM